MRTLCLLLVGLVVVVVGWAASGVDWSRDAVGQDLDLITDKPPSEYRGAAPRRVTETRLITDANGVQQAVPITRLVNSDGSVVPETPPGLVGRYQVSAYGSPSGHGCYIVDTMTGRTWHAANGQPPQVVAEALTPQSAQPATLVPTPSYTPPMLEPSPTQPPTQPPHLEEEKPVAEPTIDAAD